MEEYQDTDLVRKLKKLPTALSALPVKLSDDKQEELVKTFSDEESIYQQMVTEHKLDEMFYEGRAPDQMKNYWKLWRTAWLPIRDAGIYKRRKELETEWAQLNGFPSYAEARLYGYLDDPSFEEQLETVIQQIRPFYEQFHAYYRYKLRERYGPSVVAEKGPFQTHLTRGGNSEFPPSPEKVVLDFTEALLKQGYTSRGLFEKVDEFYQSLNMTKFPDIFWQNSILKQPDDGREVNGLWPEAYDFFQTDDVRIIQCPRVAMDELHRTFETMGDAQYILQYQNQPVMYHGPPHGGLQEAFREVLWLSFSTRKHLIKEGLLKDNEYDEDMRLNHLMGGRLSEVLQLPQWRDRFGGKLQVLEDV